MPDIPTEIDAPKKSGKPSVEHIVLGAVLVVVLAVGGFFLLKPGSSASTAKAAAAPTVDRPATAALAEPGAVAKPVTALKPTKAPLTPMTKPAYLKAGNKICARMNAATKKLGDFPSDTKAQVVYINKNYAITEHARKLLVALPAPTVSAVKLAGYYKEVAALDGTAKAAAKALAAGDTAKAGALESKLAKQSAKTNAEFVAYGLTTCGT
ncbi:hypothetical protein acdb102_06300 [Acidothermaceae bacterium B102]|nr:hypothetical protein acdb102_06300 [Acidothermaceae bacterium B102]